MTVDEQRGIVYMPMGGPAANYYGGDRPGNNLYANCIVALDALTGKLKWYFQTVHHELWDYDLPPDPVLLDIVRDGKKIPALAQAGKLGYMYILDRVTGKPVFGVEERPVPQSIVPGEVHLENAALPAQASAARAGQHHESRHRHRRRHQRRPRQSLPGSVGQEWISGLRPLHSLDVSKPKARPHI